MKKFKQCTYTLILLITCLVASPMIFKQIWNTSAEKKKENNPKTVEIDINKGSAENTSAAPPSSEPTSSSPETDPEDSDEPEITSGTDVIFVPPDTTHEFSGYVQSDYSYFDNALFIGDSRTVGLRDYGSLDNSDFFCDVGLTAGDANDAAENGELADMLISKQYGKIYIMLGINEVGNDFDSTISDYSSLIQNILEKSPDSLIYLEANLHVTKAVQNEAVSNKRIDELNTRIAALTDRQSIFYIDINPVFDDDTGNLMEEYTSDGIHVYAKYYTQWSDWFCLNTVPEN